ncbi:hypothetical protein EV128_12541 [Rhizobium azibense]|nr:hypothetical protein EV128_12541 [Rhizobium azibense]
MGHPLLSRFARGGRPVPTIRLSNTSVPEAATIGSLIAALSVSKGSGSYIFTKTADPDNKFEIVGANLNLAAALDFETKTQHSVTIQASNGVDAPLTKTFTIGIGNVLEGTLSPSVAEFTVGAAPGTLIAAITGFDIGANEAIASVVPNDGRLAIASNNQLVVGLSAASAGSINATITTTAGRTLSINVTVKPLVLDPIYRLATRQTGPGYNAEAVVLTSDGAAKTYSATLVNESGRAIDIASVALQGWGLTATGTQAAGNDFTVTGNFEYPIGGTQTAINAVVAPGAAGDSIKSDDAVLPTSIPPGASFKVNLSMTVASGAKYITRLGFAGVLTRARPDELKPAIYGVGDSIATNNGAALMNASAGRVPVYHASIVGTTAQTYGASGAANFVRQVALAKLLGITHFLANWSTNDIAAGRTVAQILGDLQAMRSLANAEGIKWIQATMLPRVSKKAAVSVQSLTSSGNIMTAQVADASKFVVDQAYTMAGATPSGYNGSLVCIAVDLAANTVSFPCVAGLASPATGTITLAARGTTNTVEWQTASASYAPGPDSPRGQFNATVRGGAFDGYVDWADAIEPYRDAGRFAVAGEKSQLPLPVRVSVVNGAVRTTTRFFTDYAVGSNTMANGLAQFLTGALAGVLKGGSNNTNGDFTVVSAFASAPAIGDLLVMWPGVCYISDDGTHPRVSTGGMGGQVLLDLATGAWIDALLASL